MAEVSAVGAPLALLVAFPGCSEPAVKGMKSFGGLPGGVVDLRPTKEKYVSEALLDGFVQILCCLYFLG